MDDKHRIKKCVLLSHLVSVLLSLTLISCASTPPSLISDLINKNATGYNAQKIQDKLNSSTDAEAKILLNAISDNYLNQKNFAQQRIHYRVKIDLLLKQMEKYEISPAFQSLAEDILLINYTSILAHFALMQHYDRKKQPSSADYHERIVSLLIQQINESGEGTLSAPMTVASLAEAEELLYISGLQIHGQSFTWYYGRPLLRTLVGKQDVPSYVLVFQPESVEALESSLTQTYGITDNLLKYIIHAELASLDSAGRSGFALAMLTYLNMPNDNSQYIEKLLERGKNENNAFDQLVLAKLLASYWRDSKNHPDRGSYLNDTIDQYIVASESGIYEANLDLANLLQQHKKNEFPAGLPMELIKKAADLGVPEAKVQLGKIYTYGDKHTQPDFQRAEQLFLEALESGVPYAASEYAYLQATRSKFENTSISKIVKILDRGVTLNDRQSILIRMKEALEKPDWTERDVKLGTQLLKKLVSFDNKTLHELNEIVWIQATHGSSEIKDLDSAFNLLIEAYDNFEFKDFSAPFFDTIARVLYLKGYLCNAVDYQRASVAVLKENDSMNQALLLTLQQYEDEYEKNHHEKAPLQCPEMPLISAVVANQEKGLGFGNGVYKGEIKQGKAHGVGTFLWDSGDSLSGKFEDGVAQGIGTYRWGEKSNWPRNVYQGQFNKGIQHGKGIYIWQNGDVYFGDYKEGQQTGSGTTLYSNGARYQGHFVDGVQSGIGFYSASGGFVYEGEFEKDQFQGYGNVIYTSGNRYQGQLKENYLNGLGTFTWLMGDTYTGEFENDELHGNGTCVFEGVSNPCQFENNKLIEHSID